MGGGDCQLSSRMIGCQGPSPRGRGRRLRLLPSPIAVGTIPAWAGETMRLAIRASPKRDHPRVGGGDTNWSMSIWCLRGPSPRGRGRPSLRSQQGDNLGTIPAWAGETHQASRFQASCRDHPRVGGGDQQRQVMALTRDHPRVGGGDATVDCRTGTGGDHPRVGGGDSVSIQMTKAIRGPSPRGRGRLRDSRPWRSH